MLFQTLYSFTRIHLVDDHLLPRITGQPPALKNNPTHQLIKDCITKTCKMIVDNHAEYPVSLVVVKPELRRLMVISWLGVTNHANLMGLESHQDSYSRKAMHHPSLV
jgi:hypothetical protein